MRLLAYGAVGIDSHSWSYPDLVAPYWRIYVNFDDGAHIRWQDGAMELQPGKAYLLPPWLHFYGLVGNTSIISLPF